MREKIAGQKIAVIQTGGTIGSYEGKMGLRPTEEASENLIHSLNGRGFDIEHFTPVLFDSSNLDVQARDKILKEVEKQLEREEIDGVVVTHGTDTILTTANMAYIGLKGLRKPVIFTGAMKAPGEEGYRGYENLLDSCTVANTGDFSTVLLSFFGHLLSVYSRKHNFDLHDPFFKPYYIRDSLGIMKDDQLICSRRTWKPDHLDCPFTVKRGEWGKVREPIIRGLYGRSPKHLENNRVKFPFLIEYALLRNRMINPIDESDYDQLYQRFKQMTKSYEMDGDELKDVWDGRETSFDPHFDLSHVPIIHYSNKPSMYIDHLGEWGIKGVIFEGAGDGHLRLEREDSYRELLSKLKESGIPAVMCTESGMPVSFRYEIGRELMERYDVISGGMHHPVEAQVRLGYLVHSSHREILEKTSEKYNLPVSKLTNMLFAGGGMFRTRYERELYEKVNYVDTRVDLLDSMFQFEESAELSGQVLSRYRHN